jgi:hypothetical protein
MSEASERWLADSFVWLDEQQSIQDAGDEAAYWWFMAALGLNNGG